jgi:phosphoglucomutase
MVSNELADLFAKVGSFYPLRENFPLTLEVKEKFTEKLRRDPTELHGTKVASAVRTDGLKLILAMDHGFVPGFRARSRSCVSIARRVARKTFAKLSAAAKKWIFD